MKPNPTPKDVQHSDIPLWAGRYARNRVLPLLCWLVGICLYTTIQMLAYTLLNKSRSIPLFIICIVMNSLFLGGSIWVTVTGRITRWFQTLTNKLYEHEGVAVPALPTPMPVHSKLKSTLIMGSLLVGPWLLLYALIHGLGVPPKYLQPTIAAVIVPLITWGVLAGADTPKWPGLLMPLLYGIHGLLILAGVRLPAFGVSYLDAFLPLFVYSMLSLTVMHLYSRYALMKLQIAVLSPMDEIAESDGEDPGNAGA